MGDNERGLILFVGNTKGGVTKTTITENLAVELSRRDYKVVLVDGDHNQRTLSKWADRRNDSIEQGSDWCHIPCFIKAGAIKKDLLTLANDYDVVLVDTGGRESAELRSALLCADIVYVPTQVSQNDLEALMEFNTILLETAEINEYRKVVALVVRSPTHPSSKEKSEAKAFLSEFSDTMKLSKHHTSERVAYRIAPRSGASVIEWTDSRAKAEIQLIVQEIIEHVSE